MNMQEQRRLCRVAGAVVCCDAKDAHFDEHVVRVMGAEMGEQSSVFVSASFYDTVDEPGQMGETYGETWTVTWKRGPVLEGRYRVVSKGSGVWIQEGGEEYVGEVLMNPTWEDLVVEAERQIRCTGDHHHIYLEAVLVAATPTEQLAAAQGGLVLDIHLSMGS